MHDNDLMIFCDGLCEPRNPGGYACWAWIAYSPKGNRLREDSGCVGNGEEMTNNLAEYHAVLNALRYTRSRLTMLSERGMGVMVYSDSKLVIEQIKGSWRCNTPALQRLLADIESVMHFFADAAVPLKFEWIPREQNQAADQLTRLAYTQARRQSRPAPPEWLQ
jgi:ribonuclease HI